MKSFVFLVAAAVITCGLLTADPARAARLTVEEEAAWLALLRAEIAARGATFEIAPNSLTRIPWEEFQARYLGLRLPAGQECHEIINDHGIGDRDLPARWDWREHEGVTGIRHQGSCGSCWAFSAAAALESAVRLAVGFEVDISEQHALVCNEGGSSCSGGWMWDCYSLWQEYGAIAEEDMPYEADDTLPCPGSTYPAVVAAGTVYDVGYTVSEIKQAILDHGVVSSTVMVYPDLVPYADGCYSHDCPGELNHAIGLVGWDDSYCDGQGAWIMKNSWGDDWGWEGYGYIRYDAACIGNNATYVDYAPIANLLGINHAPLEDTPETAAPYEIIAEIISTGGSVNLAASYLAYRLDNGSWVQAAFAATGAPQTYHAFIPAQPAGTKVEYYLHAEDTVGEAKTVPMWAPEEAYVFVVGTLEMILAEEFEEASGWSVGEPGDDAITGIWERTDPEGTLNDSGYWVQPEDDYTPAPGLQCFVTGGLAGSSVGDYDVDGGRTTLLSPVYDLSDYNLVVIDYRRWYTNRRGSSPYADTWEVSVRSGVSDWVPIEFTSICRENWSHQVHILNDFVEPGSIIQFRFVASDEGDGSLVEAVLDHFVLKGVSSEFSNVLEGQARSRRPEILAAPNPCSGSVTMAFRLPEAGPATLAIFDCAGRLVRSWNVASAEARGGLTTWDGRDARGALVPSGVYHARLAAGTQVAEQRLLVVR